MSILASIWGEQTDSQNAAGWLIDWFAGRETDAGPRVNPQTAMGLSAYYACIRCISEDIGKLPLIVYERLEPRGKRRAYEHPAYPLLHHQPNNEMSAMALRETMTSHAIGWGGGFAEIERTDRGIPVAFHLIHPSRVTIEWDGGVLVYDVRCGDIGLDVVRLVSSNVLHIHGLGTDGTGGFTMSVLAKNTIGLALAAESFGSRFFANDARPGGVLHHPGTLTDTALAHLRESWAEAHQGTEQSHKPSILEEGMEWKDVGIPPEEAQFLETRQFQVEEVARWFRMPPHKIQHLLRSTFSNIESQNIEYVTDTLQSWAVRWEQEIKRKLFTASQSAYFAEHLFKGLLRGDQMGRAVFYRQMWNIGAMSQNDIREAENENPIGPEGDEYYVPLNMQMAKSAAGIAPAIVEPDKKAQSHQHELVRQSHLPLLQDAALRVTAKEVRAVKRAAKKHAKEPEQFVAWADEFYAEHENYLVQALSAPATSCALLLCDVPVGTSMALAAVREYAREESLRARREVDSVFAGNAVGWGENRIVAHPPEMAATVYDEHIRAALVKPIGDSGDASAETTEG